MVQLRWKLADYLSRRGLTPYRLAKAAPRANPSTVYRLARAGAPPTRIDLPTLEAVLDGLRALTGEMVTLSDVIETVERSDYADRVLRDARPLNWDRLSALATPHPDEDVAGYWAEQDEANRRLSDRLDDRDEALARELDEPAGRPDARQP